MTGIGRGTERLTSRMLSSSAENHVRRRAHDAFGLMLVETRGKRETSRAERSGRGIQIAEQCEASAALGVKEVRRRSGDEGDRHKRSHGGFSPSDRP